MATRRSARLKRSLPDTSTRSVSEVGELHIDTEVKEVTEATGSAAGQGRCSQEGATAGPSSTKKKKQNGGNCSVISDVNTGPFEPYIYPGNKCKGVESGELFPCLWEASVSAPVRNMIVVPDRNCSTERGHDGASNIEGHIKQEDQEDGTCTKVNSNKIEGTNKVEANFVKPSSITHPSTEVYRIYIRIGGDSPGVWIHDVTDTGASLQSPTQEDARLLVSSIQDGYGMCFDSTRDLLVVCDGKKLKRFDIDGNVIKQQTIKGVTNLTSVAHCKKEDVYIIGHSSNKLWTINAVNFNIERKDKLFWKQSSPVWLNHAEDPCMTYYGDAGADRLVRLFPGGGSSVQLVPGTGVNALDNPRDSCLDSRQSLLLCDAGNRCVKRNYNDGELGWWEEVLPPGRVACPTCILLVANKYLVVYSSEEEQNKLICYKYRLGCIR